MMSTPQEQVQCVLWLAEHKSICAASLQLLIPCSAVHNVLHKRLCLREYKIQMIPALKLSDQVACTNFTVDMAERIDASADFLRHVCFLNEATLHVNGFVNSTTAGFGAVKIPSTDSTSCRMGPMSGSFNCSVLRVTGSQLAAAMAAIVRTFFLSDRASTLWQWVHTSRQGRRDRASALF
jgi:hypothetical protein